MSSRAVLAMLGTFGLAVTGVLLWQGIPPWKILRGVFAIGLFCLVLNAGVLVERWWGLRASVWAAWAVVAAICSVAFLSVSQFAYYCQEPIAEVDLKTCGGMFRSLIMGLPILLIVAVIPLWDAAARTLRASRRE
jgi:hypothetical protein